MGRQQISPPGVPSRAWLSLRRDTERQQLPDSAQRFLMEVGNEQNREIIPPDSRMAHRGLELQPSPGVPGFGTASEPRDLQRLWGQKGLWVQGQLYQCLGMPRFLSSFPGLSPPSFPLERRNENKAFPLGAQPCQRSSGTHQVSAFSGQFHLLTDFPAVLVL